MTACVSCQVQPDGLGTGGDGAVDAAPPGDASDRGVGPADLGRPDRGPMDLSSDDMGTPDLGRPALPQIDERISLQIDFVDYVRTGDANQLPDELRDNTPFENHSIRVDVRPNAAAPGVRYVLIHPPFGRSSGPYLMETNEVTDEIAFVTMVCATCVSARARAGASRFVVSRLVLGTRVDETGQRRWSGTGRITGSEIDERSSVSVGAASAISVRLDDVAPMVRVETTPSVLLPFEGVRLRFSEPVLDQDPLIEIDTSQGRADFGAQPRFYGFDSGVPQVTSYGLAPKQPWPPGEIRVRYSDPHADLSGNVAAHDDFVVPVHQDPGASEQVDFESEGPRAGSAWGASALRLGDDRCIGAACMRFFVAQPGDTGVLARLDTGGPIDTVAYQVRLLSEVCGARLDVFSTAVPSDEVRPFSGRQGRGLTAAASPNGACDSGWVSMEAHLAAPASEAWLTVEVRTTRNRDTPLTLLVDEIVPQPAGTTD